MVIQRITPSKYFEEEVPTQETGTNYTPWFIFAGVCIVAIVALTLAITYKK